VNGLEGNLYSSASQDLVAFLYDFYGRQANSAGRFFTTNNFAINKDAFWAVGGFDQSFRRAAGEDREFGYRWTRSGRAYKYVPSAVVEHCHDLSFKKFLLQHFNYGRAARLTFLL
jgi:GT2 family glycosyltransferase